MKPFPLSPLPLDLQPGSRVLYRDAAGREHYARIVADLGGLFHARDTRGDLALTHGDIFLTLSKP